MKLLLQCTHCGNTMLYEPKGKMIGKSKVCVYCGRSFQIKLSIRTGLK